MGLGLCKGNSEVSARVADQRLRRLTSEFPRFVRLFSDRSPFTRAGQQEYHIATIRLRRELGSIEEALANDAFTHYLYLTLQAWGIGVRASTMVPEAEFVRIFREKADDIAQFEQTHIDDPAINVSAVSEALWATIRNLGIVSNQAKIVPGTKALHHLLPELVVPVDRAYTQRFFNLQNPQFQYSQEKVFRRFFAAFVTIARRANPRQYVGAGWNTSQTKVIDNAIIGLLIDEDLAQPN